TPSLRFRSRGPGSIQNSASSAAVGAPFPVGLTAGAHADIAHATPITSSELTRPIPYEPSKDRARRGTHVLPTRLAALLLWRSACTLPTLTHAGPHSCFYLPPPVQRAVHISRRASDRRVPAFPRNHRLLRLVVPQSRSRKSARLRRRRPDSAESGNRHTWGIRCMDRSASIAWDGPRARRGPEPHGHRQILEPMVARRARKRGELAVRGLLRHRMASGQSRAGRQSADSHSRRSVRSRSRTSGVAVGA